MAPPVVTVTPRKITRDVELGGLIIPKGARVSIDLFELQNNPAVWDEPEMFRPERFIPGNEADQQSKDGLAWAPFITGPRQYENSYIFGVALYLICGTTLSMLTNNLFFNNRCIGMNFALDEQRILLSMMRKCYQKT